MIAWLHRGVDAFRGRGEAAATVPSMDGALRPNTRLESAAVLLRVAAPDNLVLHDGRVLFSTGSALCELDAAGGRATPVRTFDSPIASLASHGDLLAAGLENGAIQVFGPGRPDVRITTLGGAPIVCPTALAFRDPDMLVVCQGSQRHPPQAWKRDLMERNAAGRVWRLGIAGGSAEVLADRIAYPGGLVVSAEGVTVAESWRHRLIRLSAAAPTVVLPDLPGYPARLAACSDGGFLLAVFAPRSQLIEFVLRETRYRERMMRELEADHWVAPSLSPPKSFLEPMQGGALRTHGILKPWAPTRSYGLVVRLDARFQPVASAHSRADGSLHGVTSCLEVGGRVLVATRGGDAIVSLDLGAGEAPA